MPKSDRPYNGKQGWELVKYNWDPETNIGSFVYHRGGLYDFDDEGNEVEVQAPEVFKWAELQPLRVKR